MEGAPELGFRCPFGLGEGAGGTVKGMSGSGMEMGEGVPQGHGHSRAWAGPGEHSKLPFGRLRAPRGPSLAGHIMSLEPGNMHGEDFDERSPRTFGISQRSSLNVRRQTTNITLGFSQRSSSRTRENYINQNNSFFIRNKFIFEI